MEFKTDKEFDDFKKWTLGLLHDESIKSGVRVTFTKKDGTERNMSCTLVEGRIPADKLPKGGSESQDSSIAGSAVRVFDLDKGEWRSFRWDSIKEVKVNL